MVNPNINSFAQTPVQGQMDQSTLGTVINCRVSSAQATALVAGQAVKLDTTKTGGVPAVLALAANTDNIFGFVVQNVKDQSHAAGALVEIAQFGSIMYMTAGAAITRGASLEVTNSTKKVITNAGTNTLMGYAFDAAAADGDLIRVAIQAPYTTVQTNLVNREQVMVVTATLAEINAGKVLIPGVVGQAITVADITARVTGTFATGTSVKVQSTNGTPVDVLTYAEAAIAGTGVVFSNTANVTAGAGFGTPLGTGDGLQVVNTGSAQTGGTSIKFTISFTQQ